MAGLQATKGRTITLPACPEKGQTAGLPHPEKPILRGTMGGTSSELCQPYKWEGIIERRAGNGYAIKWVEVSGKFRSPRGEPCGGPLRGVPKPLSGLTQEMTVSFRKAGGAAPGPLADIQKR